LQRLTNKAAAYKGFAIVGADEQMLGKGNSINFGAKAKLTEF